MRTFSAFLLCAAFCVAGTTVLADDIYVDASNDTGTEDGTQAFPFTTIEQGILAAVVGDKVLVAPGAYKETVLMADGVSLIGAGWRTTFIDATGLQDSAVTFDETRLNPLLSGFTIFGGKGDQRSQIGEFPVTFGGGVLIIDSSPTIQDNRIMGNIVDEGYCLGGAIYVSAQNQSPVIRRNIIENNSALSVDAGTESRGGAIFATVKDGAVTIEQNLIRGNTAIEGGAIVIENMSQASATIRRNTFVGNRATRGAAIWLNDSAAATTEVVNNLFVENGSDAVGARGAGVFALSASSGFFLIVNNTFAHNALTQGDGGALALDDSQADNTNALAANNIFYRNAATNGGGIDHTLFGGTIRSNALFENTGGDLYDAGGSTATLVDNQIVDPGFIGSAKNRYRLASSSPLVDTAADDVAPAQDLEGVPRPFDGNGDMLSRSDFGASEYPAREIETLRFVSGDQLEWDVASAAEAYHLHRGSFTRLLATGSYTQDPAIEPLAARFCDILPAELPFEDVVAVNPGESVFYLAVVTIDAYRGSFGLAPDGYERPNTRSCP